MLPLVFLIIAILTDERWYSLWLWFTFLWWLVMVSTFSCTCYLFKSTLWKSLFRSFTPFLKNRQFFFFNYWVLWIHNVFWILNLLSHMWFANIFFVFPRLLFHFVVFFLKICAGDFQCDIVSFIFPFVVLLLSLEKNHFQDQCQGSFPLYLLLKVLCSQVLPSAFK